jgi:hypothetical protein
MSDTYRSEAEALADALPPNAYRPVSTDGPRGQRRARRRHTGQVRALTLVIAEAADGAARHHAQAVAEAVWDAGYRLKRTHRTDQEGHHAEVP